MQPLIHKASVHLTSDRLPSSVSLGDVANLRLRNDDTIIVTLDLPSRLPFGLGESSEFVLGTLGQQARDFLKPALQRAAHLRVRIVEFEPAHLSRNGRTRIYISVWGDPKALLP